jgi:hypothetical protein
MSSDNPFRTEPSGDFRVFREGSSRDRFILKTVKPAADFSPIQSEICEADAGGPSKVSVIPIVTCPNCGQRMSLSRIAPAVRKPQGRLHFACSCGFGYPADIGFSHRL